MKIRNGFVSNSSSASFIVTIESELSDEQIQDYIRRSDDWLDHYWDGGEYHKIDFFAEIAARTKGLPVPEAIIVDKEPIKNDVYHKQSDGTIELNYSTTMFNDWMSIPSWRFIRAVNEDKIPGIKLKKIVRTEDQMDDTNEVVEFDSECWEYQSKFNKEGSNNSSYKMAQNEVELDYLEYLVDVVDYKLTPEETVSLAKKHLNQ